MLVCLLTALKVDWTLVAEKAGYKTAASAQEMFRVFMKKSRGSLPPPIPQSQTGTVNPNIVTPPTTPKNTSKKRNLDSENGEKGAKRQKIKKGMGAVQDRSVVVPKVQKERAGIVRSDDSDTYGEA